VSSKRVSGRLQELNITTGKISRVVIKNYQLTEMKQHDNGFGEMVAAAIERMEALNIPPIDPRAFALEAIKAFKK
jgi:hypothetical protein